MIRASLAWTTPSYEGLAPPFPPAAAYPELEQVWGESLVTVPSNSAYAGVRTALRALELDAANFGSPRWNPLGDLVEAGGSIVLKPNFIRHWNPLEQEGISCVITHGAILRAVADYAWIAAGPEGSVTLAEAPQMDCDWEQIRKIVGLDEIVEAYAGIGRDFRWIDLRRESVRFEDGIVVSRSSLPGDPAGYRVCPLGERSFFEGSGLDPRRMRGADYDARPTSEHHQDGRNDYLLSETVLSADLVVNLPKIKTHKKTGVTLSQKNLVGINGDKNWLPHHCLGSTRDGGDEFPDRRWIDRLRSQATEWARPWLQRGKGLAFFRLARRAERATRGDAFIRAGNWHGNRTTWRMCLDLNRAFLYSNAQGLHLEAGQPVRKALHVLDGIVAGENNGPLAPTSRPLGAVIASTDPVAADLVAVRLMGFDERRLPILDQAMREPHTPVTAVRRSDEVQVAVGNADEQQSAPRIGRLDQIESERPFAAHPGWKGHVERDLDSQEKRRALA